MSEFQTTLWTVIKEAAHGDGAALEDFIVKYRPPVVGFIRRQGLTYVADDLAQDEQILGHLKR